MNSYKSCVINVLNENLYSYIDDVDNKLNKCIHDYYDKPSDCDMLKDTMALFDSVRTMVNMCLFGNVTDVQVSMMVEDLIAREIRLCDEIPYEKKTNNQLWQEYRAVLEDNIDKNIWATVHEVRKVKHNVVRYINSFDTNYEESQKDNECWQEIALVYPQVFH